MKRHLSILLIILPTILSLTGCAAAYSDMKVKSIKVDSFQFASSKTIDMVLEIGVDNPAPDLQIDTLSAVVKAGGNHVVYLSAADVMIEGNTDSTYVVPVKGSLAPGINVFYIMGALKQDSFEAITADLWAKVKLRGVFGKTLEYEDIPFDDIKDLF